MSCTFLSFFLFLTKAIKITRKLLEKCIDAILQDKLVLGCWQFKIKPYGSTTNFLAIFGPPNWIQKHNHLSLSNFLLLLFQEGRGDTSNVVLGTEQQGPQIPHELTRILSIQEACQVDLHHLTIGVLQHTHEWGGERSIQPLMVIMTLWEVRKLYSLLNYPCNFVGNIIKTCKIQANVFLLIASLQSSAILTD